MTPLGCGVMDGDACPCGCEAHTVALVLAGVGGTLCGVLGLCWARGVGYKWGSYRLELPRHTGPIKHQVCKMHLATWPWSSVFWGHS